ncbi:MAG: hypothetical protein RRY64_08385 [Oscillospiraceae bacterium]
MGKWMALVVACLLLTGCSSLLDREYSTVEAHSSKYWESEEDTLRAENYQDVVNDLLLLVGQHTEDAVIRLYNYEDDMTVSETLDSAASEVQQETPLGAYAVEYITAESRAQRGYYELTVRLAYRRTAEQVQTVVNATSTEALRELLTAALDGGKSELAVRIGYFKDEQAEVEQLMAALRQERGLEDTPPWTVAYYPAVGTVGLLEFVLTPETATP